MSREDLSDKLADLRERYADQEAKVVALERDLKNEREASLSVRLELQAAYRNLSETQARCTELIQEARDLRKRVDALTLAAPMPVPAKPDRVVKYAVRYLKTNQLLNDSRPNYECPQSMIGAPKPYVFASVSEARDWFAEICVRWPSTTTDRYEIVEVGAGHPEDWKSLGHPLLPVLCDAERSS